MTTINSTLLNYLYSSVSTVSSGNGNSNIVNIDLSATTSNSGLSSQSSVQLYNYYQSQGTKLAAANAKDPQVKAEVDYFKKTIGTIKTVDDLFKNQRLYKFISTALGLGDTSGQFALVKGALTSYAIDPAKLASRQKQGLIDKGGRPTNAAAQQTLIDQGYLDPKNPSKIGLANQLNKTAYIQGALQLDLAKSGLTTIQSASTIDDLVKQYQTYTFEGTIGKTNAAVEQARYFAKQASNVTSVYQLLADRTLRDVISTTFSIPQQLAVQPIETQAKAFSSRLDLKQLQDPKFVSHFVSRFLVAADQSGTSGSSSSNATALTLLQNR